MDEFGPVPLSHYSFYVIFFLYLSGLNAKKFKYTTIKTTNDHNKKTNAVNTAAKHSNTSIAADVTQ